MTETTNCLSCTMPIESGTLCPHCSNEAGELRPFGELFERMVQWTLTNEAELDRAEAERRTLAFMGERPAWKDHPELAKRRDEA